MSTVRAFSWRHWPLIGIAIAIALFVTATAHYPGGSSQSPNAVGYTWSENFVSSLFAPLAVNGQPNTARPWAAAAMLVYAVTIACVFKGIANASPTRTHKLLIEIGGIGSAVYGFLVITPMHDLMITMSLPFTTAAIGAMLHVLYITRRMRLFVAGAASGLLLAVCAGMYYAGICTFLPVVQKASMATGLAWTLATYYAVRRN